MFVSLVLLVVLSSVILTAVLQRMLRRRRRRWADILAFVLTFLPGIASVVGLKLFFIAVFGEGLTRVAIAYTSIDFCARLTSEAFWVLTGTMLLVWTVCECVARWGSPPEARPSGFPNLLLVCCVPILLVLTGLATHYLVNYTTLADAVRAGDVELARRRLESNLLGVDSNTGLVGWNLDDGTYVEPLLPLAAQKGDIEMARLLLDYGASVNLPSHWRSYLSQGGTPVRAAAREGHWAMVEFLLLHGGNPNDVIHTAAEANAVDALRMLLDHGADPQAVDEEGCTVADVAALAHSDDALEMISAHGGRLSNLNAFIRKRRVDLLEQAIEAGVDPDKECRCNSSFSILPLFEALRWERPEAVAALLRHGASVDLRDEHGRTPLHVAVSIEGARRTGKDERMYKTVAIAKLLIAHGADPWAAGPSGYTPLQRAEAAGNTKLVEYLRSLQPAEK
jgi:ankyrin repeat protein